MSSATLPNSGTNGNGVVRIRSRYFSTCPACKKQIAPGQSIRLYPNKWANDPRRCRWQHADCDNIPPADLPTQSAAATTADSEEADKLASLVRNLSSEVGCLHAKLKDLESSRPRTIELRTPKGDTRKIEGATHPVFERVVKLAAARKHIFLPGPSGCGKSHLAKQVAEALELRFGFISCSAGMSESQLLGRTIPTGDHGQFEFQTTQFLECYENGGVFLFDEIDAADANVLLVINSALANGHLSVPSRTDNPVAKRHPDFVCLAAANTWGRGADRQYCGRNELDESTLDRFRIGCVPMDYDDSLEAQLCPDEKLRFRLQDYRLKAQANRLERIVSTRFIAEAYEMKHRWGWTDDDVDRQLFNGWRNDEVRKVKGA